MYKTAILLMFFLAAALTLRAQFPMATGRTAERSQSDAERDLEERIAVMRYLIDHAGRGTPVRRKDPKLALAELQEDFVRIQIVNKDLVLTSSKSNAVDFEFVSRSASEIHKRAERLLSNLALPEPDPAAVRERIQPISDVKQLQRSITAMGWLIYYFAKNPLFKEAKVIETSSATMARGNLEHILELSTAIKTGSEQLGKKPEKTN